MTTLESSILKTIQYGMLIIFRYILRIKGRVIRKNHFYVFTSWQALNIIAYLTVRAHILEVVEVFNIYHSYEASENQTSSTSRQTCPFPKPPVDF